MGTITEPIRGGDAHDNCLTIESANQLPPDFALAFIMKV